MTFFFNMWITRAEQSTVWHSLALNGLSLGSSNYILWNISTLKAF